NLLDARRQMLHAETLTLPHPVTREPMKFHAPVPEDMQSLLNRLRG
ncbi:MAG: RNA pseudouridine synthase, partial [Kiritimatiellae bacterium]|nr:RNA pseudouridine synthase [Kiritimatiellia bacterium]